ncbi:LytR/AlgR family response regulator transcription factor [Mucilaginibacter lacusdianchii]|uniref:LytR/AlgR family response regulator transcription factor n=1 Tax=Mucilaginibacter lacusdianchii TaxID=2684211 RepID=UPI00131C0233|nr:LytTR family DNA-binding domain-containing protein [Mucilaginibacter sp. JXJ CY 39]
MKAEKIFNCLIVDDEPPAREILKRYIRQIPMLNLIDECNNALQALAVLQSHAIDLLFLDIHMPQVSGLELIKTLKAPPKIVLTTAFEQYALQGFELDVADYLLKPIQFDRFLKAVMKALPKEVVQDQVSERPVEPLSNQAFLYFRADRKMVKVLIKDIQYIESLKDYVKIITEKGTIITKYSIAALAVMLPEESFIRTHRSFIVAIDKITSFTNESLEIQQYQIPVSKLYRQLVLKSLNVFPH